MSHQQQFHLQHRRPPLFPCCNFASVNLIFPVVGIPIATLLSPNSILFPIVCLSMMSLRAVITTMNPFNTNHEIDSKPVLAFTLQSLLPKLAGSNVSIVLIGGEKEGNAPAPIAGIVGTLEEMMRKEPSRKRVVERVNQDNSVTLLYSSGTTDASKGVVSSYRNLIAMVQTIASRFQHEEGDQIFICMVLMFYIYGLAVFAMGMSTTGEMRLTSAK